MTSHGVVMSADSYRVNIFGGRNEVVPGSWSRNPIIMRHSAGFVGLIGFAGTETLGGADTADWLRRFSTEHHQDDLGSFCRNLAADLTELWANERLSSILEILVAGEVGGDIQFWYVRNSHGLIDEDWKHHPPRPEFHTEPDLDNNYIPEGESKDELLQRVMFSFRQGVLLPAAPVFNRLDEIMRDLRVREVEEFAPPASLDDVGQYARLRMEFLKALCEPKKGIYREGALAPIGGEIHVYGVTPDGEICEWNKQTSARQVVRPGRT